ncbi:MAG TPA: FdrA family protein [Actinomycetes bacterium]|nr:FdrA family protein [Actinomycetes bacterium]
MQASRTVATAPGVSDAMIAMATELNLDLIEDLGFERPAGAGPNDMVVAVAAADRSALDHALSLVDAALTARAPSRDSAGGSGAGPASGHLPRTVSAAARDHPEAELALISVPGPHAFTEAMDALESGLSVVVFSDNVPVELEIRLKDEAAHRGLLVMGPDCGTASVGGLGLGFANAVRPGPVGIVAASGTGAQQLMCLLDAAGVGISQCLGVGGRDLSAAVGGRATRQALRRLDDDPATELIAVISKPPDPQVAQRLPEETAELATPLEFGLLEPGGPDLTRFTEQLLRRLGVAVPAWPFWAPGRARPARPGVLRGLYGGGTLAAEAHALATAALGPVAGDDLAATGHLVVDFGADQFTVGRAHPMLDPALRNQRLAADLADPAVGVILLDVELGYGVHPDPAGELAAVLAAAGHDPPAVVTALVGTLADPQDMDGQAKKLTDAGAYAFASNAQAVGHAIQLLQAAR